MPLKILISGAGCSGPALATFLLRSNPSHVITIVERHPTLRSTGQQIDIRAQGIPIMQRAHLLEAVQTKAVHETGVVFLDVRGRQTGRFDVNESGKGAQSITSEYEILRGDLVEIWYDASLEAAKKSPEGKGVRYEFGKWITGVQQDDDGVTVTFSDGTTDRYDLLVAADGQGSRTRRMVWGEDTDKKAYHYKGLSIAFYNILREEGDGDVGKFCFVPDFRAIGTRSVPENPMTQVYLCKYGPDNYELKEWCRMPLEQQKEVWTRNFRGAAWQGQNERLLDGIKTSDDFYACDIVQIKMGDEGWTKGRVVLLGDAGYAPSPLTGMGTTIGLVGCYILAGETARHGDNVSAALAGYNTAMRPFVDEVQKLPVPLRLVYHRTRWGVAILNWIVWLVSTLKLDQLLFKLAPATKGGLGLPEYPELKMDGESESSLALRADTCGRASLHDTVFIT